MVKAAVVGARGYLGRETTRLLLGHPDVDGVVPISRSAAGDPFGRHVPALRHVDLTIQDDSAAADADVLFLATPKGQAARYAALADETGATVVDLSRDHRLQGIRGEGGWIYGLADKEPVPKGTKRIANPGCYPTATLLGALPAVEAGLATEGPVIADGKSGVSGAGVDPSPAFHYPEMNESVRAYKVGGHDHTEEMAARLTAAHADPSAPRRPVRFTPHLVPQTRGLLSTVYLPMRAGASPEEAAQTYAAAYAGSRFVRLVPEPDTAHVRGSNHADLAVHADPDAGLLVIRCAIDNLVKGGAGQAVQNMNDALGLPSAAGLDATGGSP